MSAFVTQSVGTLPIVLTCSHGGDAAPAGVAQRMQCASYSNNCSDSFATSSETRLKAITLRVAKALTHSPGQHVGQSPSVVIAEFRRNRIDANRPDKDFKSGRPPVACNCAFMSATAIVARPIYDEYHDAVAQRVAAIMATHQQGLLIDLHGFTDANAQHKIIVGTSNGVNIKRLATFYKAWRVTGAGRKTISLRQPTVLFAGLIKTLAQCGYSVAPSVAFSFHVDAKTGGYTVDKYGSSKMIGIDAIQIEIESSLRNTDSAANQVADDLAIAINNLYELCLKIGYIH